MAGKRLAIWHASTKERTRGIQAELCCQVTVHGRARLGHDVFLGEVVIPLREVEGTTDGHSRDLRRYILGRRNAKEKVRSRQGEKRVSPGYPNREHD